MSWQQDSFGKTKGVLGGEVFKANLEPTSLQDEHASGCDARGKRRWPDGAAEDNDLAGREAAIEGIWGDLGWIAGAVEPGGITAGMGSDLDDDACSQIKNGQARGIGRGNTSKPRRTSTPNGEAEGRRAEGNYEPRRFVGEGDHDGVAMRPRRATMRPAQIGSALEPETLPFVPGVG